jgi:hypothetical protein
MHNRRKYYTQKLLQIFFSTHQESSILKTRTRRYGKNIERSAALHSLKSALDILHRQSKIGTTLLFGIRFMSKIARWKDNFINYNLEGCFITCSIKLREKLWKMRQQQRRDGSWWWRYDEGLEPWLDDDKKKLKDIWVNKGKEVKAILKHMAIRDYERFMFFHT